MTSVEVSTTSEAVVAPFDELNTSPVSAVEPVNPMNNDLRMYTKSVEQAESDEQQQGKQDKAVSAASKEETVEEEGIEVAKSCGKAAVESAVVESVFNEEVKEAIEETKAEETPVLEEEKLGGEVKAADEELKPTEDEKPAVAEKEEPAKEENPVVEEAPVEKKEVKPKSLAPVRLVASRSFHLKPRTKAYPLNRALSFDSKKGKEEAAKKAEESQKDAPPKSVGVPFLRRLSFRGRKEMKAQQQAAAADREGAPAPKPAHKPPLPVASPPKPPRAATPVLKSGAAEKKPETPASIAKKPSKDASVAGFQDEKKETDYVAANSLEKTDSLISTRSKDSLGLRPVKAGVIAELVSRSEQGKIQRTPTFQEAKEEQASPVPPSPAPRPPSPAVVASKDSVVKASSTEKEPSVGKTPSVDKTPSANMASSVDKTPSANMASSVEKASSVELNKAESESVAAQSTDAVEQKPVDAVPESKGTKSPSAESVPVDKPKEDIAEDGTEATETEPEVVTEEKNGLVVTSSASEVEVTAGSGFFCEKFCCGLTLTTAGSR